MRSSYKKVLCLLSIAMLMIVMANTGAQVQGKESTTKPDAYPAPRWASYLKRRKSIDDSMPRARDLLRNKAGFGDIPLAWVWVCFSRAKKS
jgi:hypothetical protein